MEDEPELMHDIRDACHRPGVAYDTLIKESAPSQYEINLYHTNDAVVRADQAVMLQRSFEAWQRSRPDCHIYGQAVW